MAKTKERHRETKECWLRRDAWQFVVASPSRQEEKHLFNRFVHMQCAQWAKSRWVILAMTAKCSSAVPQSTP